MIDKGMQKSMTDALASGDTKAIEVAALAITKSKADRAKVEATALLAESTALAGNRETLASSFHKIIAGSVTVKSDSQAIELVKQLAGNVQTLLSMKAKGFTYTIDHKEDEHGRLDANGTVFVKGGVGLLIPTIKATASGGGGGSGKTKEEFGMSLSEVYDKYATEDDKTAMVAAESKDTAASEKLGKQTNSNAWRVKNDVKKKALSDGLLAPNK